jgi:hypothetical protein
MGKNLILLLFLFGLSGFSQTQKTISIPVTIIPTHDNFDRMIIYNEQAEQTVFENKATKGRNLISGKWIFADFTIFETTVVTHCPRLAREDKTYFEFSQLTKKESGLKNKTTKEILEKNSKNLKNFKRFHSDVIWKLVLENPNFEIYEVSLNHYGDANKRIKFLYFKGVKNNKIFTFSVQNKNLESLDTFIPLLVTTFEIN